MAKPSRWVRSRGDLLKNNIKSKPLKDVMAMERMKLLAWGSP
jgi:hypothetical protein